MDAPGDRDVKLQRASSELIQEFKNKLQPLLWKSRVENGRAFKTPHRLAQEDKTTRLIFLLEPFQEWPQLLDPHLVEFLPPLIAAFVAYLHTYDRSQYKEKHTRAKLSVSVSPLPRAICRILYIFCKVRGEKVVSRFFNNEPKNVEPMLRAFIEWDAAEPEDDLTELPTKGHVQSSLIWEERYVMLSWLSHLLLSPFDLANLSSDTIPIPGDNLSPLVGLSPKLPRVASTILSIALTYVVAPGKEREAASALLARLALRLDMQRLGLLDVLIRWSFSILRPGSDNPAPPVYTCIGVSTFVARLISSGQPEDLSPFLVQVFDGFLHIAQDESTVSQAIRSSTSARKVIVKILRAITAMTLSLDERPDCQIPSDKVSAITEDAIDYFLVALADKGTPVRFAASKALSIVALKLVPEMASEVIEAVIGSLDENILFEKSDGTLVTPLDAMNMEGKPLKRNLSAVDPQKWQGLTLTLAHLLFRRSPPTHQLLQIFQSLVSGLDFEQRSSTGSSIGTGIRDASCFGIWALSRKYTTKELQALDTKGVKAPIDQESNSILQMLAVELVCAACVDPSGNIRRGASAALQELIGRHPDTIHEGIALVQVVDYFSVARRSRAMVDVTKGAVSLGDVYWSPLLNSLLYWRGIDSPDVESRRLAASAIGELSLKDSYTSISIVLERLTRRLSALSSNSVEARHGCILSLAAVVDGCLSHRTEGDLTENEFMASVSSRISGLWEVFNSTIGFTEEFFTLPDLRPDLTAEAASKLLSSLSQSCAPTTETSLKPICPPPSDHLLEKAIHTLLLSIPRGDDIAIGASSKAASDLFALLQPSRQTEIVQGWFNNIHAAWKSATGEGQISALGAVFHRISEGGTGRELVRKELFRCTGEEESLRKRTSAVRCLTNEVFPQLDMTKSIADDIIGFLNDYTTDRRGDIGSLIRVEAIHAVNITVGSKPLPASGLSYLRPMIACVARLAAEKLDKVRFQAWSCLQTVWESSSDFPPLRRKYEHFSEVTSPEYFEQLLELLRVDWLRQAIVQGLITSASAGTEGLIRASRLALAEYINSKEAEEKDSLKNLLFQELLTVLENNMEDDRYAIPAMEVIGFLLDNDLITAPIDSPMNYRKLFLLTQKAHFKSSNMPRIDAAVKIYACLSRIDSLNRDVNQKMTGMLLHPYPKIRTTVADQLFGETRLEELKKGNWSMPPKQLKTEVAALRGVLVA